MSNFDVDAPGATRFDLVREGAHRDGVEIVHYSPRFPVPGTKAERRVERTVAMMFLLAGGAGLAFLIVYIWWPFEYEMGSNASKLYTPLLGLTLGLTLAGIGFGVLLWAKKLLPEEVAVEKRHIGGSPPDERKITGATIAIIGEETGITRRPLLKGAVTLGLLPIAGIAVVPLVGGLIKDPTKIDPTTGKAALFFTGFDPGLNGGKPVRLVRQDYSPIRPADISVGGQITAYPGIPEGVTNKWADSPTLLIHLRETDAAEARKNLSRVEVNAPTQADPDGAMWRNYVAYSKICTHLGCPASLYEQQTNRLLCPCHQSQFLITDNAKPIFGPATRRLPMLPISVDEEGYFIATSDFAVPIGPGFWERP